MVIKSYLEVQPALNKKTPFKFLKIIHFLKPCYQFLLCHTINFTNSAPLGRVGL